MSSWKCLVKIASLLLGLINIPFLSLFDVLFDFCVFSQPNCRAAGEHIVNRAARAAGDGLLVLSA